MSKFLLTASKAKAPKEGQLQFHATMSLGEFIDNGYATKGNLGVVINPNGNKHPKGLFLSWKSPEGVAYSGAVSHKIEKTADITDPVVSIVSTPDNDDMFVLFHNRAELAGDNIIFSY